jgi:citrate synthase
VRIVGSSKASIYSSISAGINALWGPLHGGANQEVILMLEQIKKTEAIQINGLQKQKIRMILSA